MKKVAYLLLIIFFSISFLSCDDKEIYGNVIPSVEFDRSTYCHLAWDLKNEKVYRIDNMQEFKKHMNCIENPELSEIDFQKYTLLVARGAETTGDSVYETIVTQTGINKYTFNVIILKSITTVASGWNTAVLVPKLKDKVQIDFVKDYKLLF